MTKGRVFWPVVVAVVATDYVSKRMVENALEPGQSVRILGEFLRFTLGYNTGIAFGMSVGVGGRPLLIVFTIIAIAGILWIYRTTDERQKLQVASLAMILGGAVGNLLDRFASASGVVDFIDAGVGSMRFWTFNIADSAITVGAILLVISSWWSERPVKHG